MKIGFIGLGAMGRPMAERLLGADYELVVFDVRPEGIAALAEKGATPGSSPRNVAEQTEVTLTSLPNAAIVTSAMRGDEGVFAGAGAGHLVIDLSTVDPGSTRKLAEEGARIGISYMDAPVSGGVRGAAEGTLTIMVGGSDQAFQLVEPILKILGKKIYHVGKVGSGNSMKIINNMLLGANMASLAEALVLGMRIGLTPQSMFDIISQSSGSSYVLKAKMPDFIMKGDFAPGFMLDLQYKDLNLAISTAGEVNMPLPMTSLATQFFETARARGYGSEDVSSVIKIWEELMVTKVRG
ncbi:MAG: NAD(P)-dependent oxidoreductase [Deltaproteobacteria bacterium]|nr:NAD(P)-dependent oxidoreductase [Deltaproteobacteria bacterium]